MEIDEENKIIWIPDDTNLEELCILITDYEGYEIYIYGID